MDSTGNVLWENNFTTGATHYCQMRSVREVSDGGFILGGYGGTTGAGRNGFIVKVDSNGDSLWGHVYGGTNEDRFWMTIPTLDGGFISVGRTKSWTANWAGYILKTDANGDSVWQKLYGGSGVGVYGEVISCIYQFSDSSYVCGGNVTRVANDADFWILRLDKNGDSLWSSGYGNTTGAEGYHNIFPNSSTGFLLPAGNTSVGPIGFRDACLVKANSAGDSLWTRYFGGQYNDEARWIIEAPDGNYVFSGYKSTGFTSTLEDFWLVKVDTDGNLLWERTYGGLNEDYCYQLCLRPNGDYMLAGFTRSYSYGENDGWVIWVRGAAQVPPQPPVQAKNAMNPYGLATGWGIQRW